MSGLTLQLCDYFRFYLDPTVAVGFLIERKEDKEMKKTQKWFYSLAAAALIFSGCRAKPQEKDSHHRNWGKQRNA